MTAFNWTNAQHCGASLALRCKHCVVQFLWQQSAASDCNQERQHTLANCCSPSSAVSSALCSRSRSLLLQCLSCPNASAQVLGVLSKMIQQLELIVKNYWQRNCYAQAGWQLPYGDYTFSIARSSIVTNPASR